MDRMGWAEGPARVRTLQSFQESGAACGRAFLLRAPSLPFLGPEGRGQRPLFGPVSATLESPGRGAGRVRVEATVDRRE